MTDDDASTYGNHGADASGDRGADASDTRISRLDDETARTVACLAALDGRGPALAWGIGTGRVALPLAAPPAAVSGINAAARVARRAQLGSDEIPVTRDSVAGIGPADHRRRRGRRQTSLTTAPVTRRHRADKPYD